MAEYYVPTKIAEAEFVEKRSRFIGNIWPVESEEEARAHIEEMRKKHYDSRHNCWAYRLREEVWNVVCVVTRYFGGILLGAGGLTRAYGRSAKDALDASGISVVRPWSMVEVDCPYPLFERVKLELPPLGGIEGDHDFGADITFRALLPQGMEEQFGQRMGELSAGGAVPRIMGTEWKAVPRDEKFL